MLETERGRVLITDAWALYADAIEMLEQGHIRNAAEKAWGATKRATDALILERTGREPNRTSQTSGGIRALGRESEAMLSLRDRYATEPAPIICMATASTTGIASRKTSLLGWSAIPPTTSATSKPWPAMAIDTV